MGAAGAGQPQCGYPCGCRNGRARLDIWKLKSKARERREGGQDRTKQASKDNMVERGGRRREVEIAEAQEDTGRVWREGRKGEEGRHGTG